MPQQPSSNLDQHVKELIKWYQTPQGRKAFKKLRSRRFSNLVSPPLPTHSEEKEP